MGAGDFALNGETFFQTTIKTMKTTLMNLWHRRSLAAVMCAGLVPCLAGAQDKPAEPKTKTETVKPARPAAEKVPFLGVVLGPVDEALAAQVSLPEGAGVIVRAVMPDSPAAKAGVKQHDLLHHFNDQLLVNEAQLQTLVRQAGIGSEITLKLLRKGREESVVVKLGETDEAKQQGVLRMFGGSGPMHPKHFAWPTPPSPMPGFPAWDSEGFNRKVKELQERIKDTQGDSAKIREEIERFQKEIQEQTRKMSDGALRRTETMKKSADGSAHAGGSVLSTTKDGDGTIRVEIITGDGKGGGEGSAVVTATADGTGNVIVSQSNMSRTAWADADGSGELVVENGKKRLTVKDKNGKETFSGPVDTDEQRKSLPPNVRERLERIEKGVKVEVRPAGKGGEI